MQRRSNVSIFLYPCVLFGWSTAQSTYRGRVDLGRVYLPIEWQRPLSGVHPIMMEKLAQAGEGGGCTPTPFHSYLPSRTTTKFHYTLQLRGQIHSPYFILRVMNKLETPRASSVLSFIEGVHIGARALHVQNLIWFGCIAFYRKYVVKNEFVHL